MNLPASGKIEKKGWLMFPKCRWQKNTLWLSAFYGNNMSHFLRSYLS